jgi:hypothetical protein
VAACVHDVADELHRVHPLLVRLREKELRQHRQPGAVEVACDVHVLERGPEFVADLRVHLVRHVFADQHRSLPIDRFADSASTSQS